jgi:hypothetical protein
MWDQMKTTHYEDDDDDDDSISLFPKITNSLAQQNKQIKENIRILIFTVIVVVSVVVVVLCAL